MIEVIDEIRWDVRPAPNLGTVEVRICDGVSTLTEMRAAGRAGPLPRRGPRPTGWSAGEKLPTMPPWHVQENKWRAARYGLDAWIILDEHSEERLMQDDLRRPPRAPGTGGRAPRLCRRARAWWRRSRAAGASYQRQRAVADDTDGDLVAVVDSVVREL